METNQNIPSKIIKVEIKDAGNIKTFQVRLFGALEGLNFLDKLVANGEKFSIKTLAVDLLPLASIVAPDGHVIDNLSIDKVDSYFENPLAVFELCYKILSHQMVFTKESKVFQKLIPDLSNIWNTEALDSQTKSEI